MTSYLHLSNTAGTCALVDDDLLEELVSRKWHLLSNGYCGVSNKGKVLYLHREVIRLKNGSIEEQLLDHANGNPLDNRASNLRYASKSQNMCNRGKTKANTSGYKGVVYHSQSCKWRAYIKKQYKQYYLGIYATPKEAAVAYNVAAARLHGEFAVLNQI
jgi:hypothetical protein